jgi:hypothetical protein
MGSQQECELDMISIFTFREAHQPEMESLLTEGRYLPKPIKPGKQKPESMVREKKNANPGMKDRKFLETISTD